MGGGLATINAARSRMPHHRTPPRATNAFLRYLPQVAALIDMPAIYANTIPCVKCRFRCSGAEITRAAHTCSTRRRYRGLCEQVSWRIYDILSMLRRLWLRGLLNAITLIYTILFAALTGNNTAITQQITTATTTTTTATTKLPTGVCHAI